jgi:hypothetical protein
MYVPPELKGQHEIWAKRLDAARRKRIVRVGTAIFKGRSRADVDARIAKARRDSRINELTDIAAVFDPYPAIDLSLLRPERGSSIAEGFLDQPNNPLNFHLAHRKEIITPPPLLVSETVDWATYFRFQPQWFQVAAWRFLMNGGLRACISCQ